LQKLQILISKSDDRIANFKGFLFKIVLLCFSITTKQWWNLE